MKDLVIIQDETMVTTTLAIAEGTGVEHRAVIQLVRKHIKDFQELGPCAFQMRVVKRSQGGGNKGEIALLNEHQATLLITYMRNSDIVRAFKVKLVKEFYRMAGELATLKAREAKRIASRQEARLEYKPMAETLQIERAKLGKGTASYHYANEANLINKVALGYTAKAFKEEHNIPEDAALREHLTALQIACIVDLQRANTVFMQMGMGYEDRKLKLHEMFKRNHDEALTEEIHRLEA